MKFYCDKCQAKYSIADEKVRGKVLKVRCKKCANIITVREPKAPVAGAPGASPAPSELPWYYALNGQTFGPYQKQDLMRMFESGELSDACYIWNESFVEWLPVRNVPEFVPALDRGGAIRPRNKTIGISGALEAIKVEQANLQQLGSEASEEEEGAVPEPMADRIGALRDRLKQHQQTPESKSNNPFAAKQTEKDEELKEKPAFSLPPRPGAAAEEEEDDATSQMSIAEISGLLDAPADLGGGSTEAVEDGAVEFSRTTDFATDGATSLMEESSSLLDEPSHAEEDGLLPEETREDLPAFIGADLGENQLDFSRFEDKSSNDDLFVDKRSHFIDDADEPEAFQASNSLLIQMDSIQKEGRSKRVLLVGAIILLFCAVGVAAVITSQNAKKTEQPASSGVYDDSKKELVFNTYSKKERGSLFYELDQEEEVISADGPAIDDEEEVEEPSKPSRVIVARNDKTEPAPSKSKTTGPDLRGMNALLNGSKKQDDALNNSSRKGSRTGGLRTGGDDGAVGVTGSKIGSSERPSVRTNPGFSAPSVRNPSGAKFNRGEDNLGKKEDSGPKLGVNGTLSSTDAKKGFKKISRSVQSCHQRQVTRGLPIDAPKVHITVEIQNDGSVSSVKIDPSSLESSEFASCLNSHRRTGRWKFAEFSGKSVKIRHTYVLQ